MTRVLWVVLIVYPLMVGIGQILFKLASERITPDQTVLQRALEPMLVSAFGLYAALAVVWLLIVRELPLSAAYPFVALSFVFTPMLAWILLGEKLNFTYLIGILFICAGVVITQRALDAA
ncbi:MAG: EamA family transporter [Pseudomonadota bacterium]